MVFAIGSLRSSCKVYLVKNIYTQLIWANIKMKVLLVGEDGYDN